MFLLFSDNNIGDEGGRLLFDAMKSNSSLTSLSLSGIEEGNTKIKILKLF